MAGALSVAALAGCTDEQAVTVDTVNIEFLEDVPQDGANIIFILETDDPPKNLEFEVTTFDGDENVLDEVTFQDEITSEEQTIIHRADLEEGFESYEYEVSEV